MSLEDIQRYKTTSNIPIEVSSVTISEVRNLYSSANIMKYIFCENPYIHAKKFLPIPITEHPRMKKLAKDEITIVSGSMHTQDLTLSTYNIHEWPLGVVLYWSYDDSLDGSTALLLDWFNEVYKRTS